MSDLETLAPEVAPLVRRRGLLDSALAECGRALQVLGGTAQAARPSPAAGEASPDDAALSAAERRHAAGLMRVNHVGEVCAQALYRGQAVFCRDEQARTVLRRAAAEEVDHLAWCRQRLDELQSRPSWLNPLWYAGSFSLGLAAGYAGRAKNLGFMAETEAQVEQHLQKHLDVLPAADARSRGIIEQMRQDEARHRASAQEHGGRPLPLPARLGMRIMSKIMTTTAYRI